MDPGTSVLMGLRYRLKGRKSSDRALLLAKLANQSRQFPHIGKGPRGTSRTQHSLVLAGTMAAAEKAEHGHAGRNGPGDPGHAVLDDDAALRFGLHLFGGEQEEIGRGLAARDLCCRENVRRKLLVETGAGKSVANLLRRSA